MVCLFPGQGSHYLGMGKDLLDVGDRFFLNLLEVASDTVKHDLLGYISGAKTDDFIKAANLQPLISSVSLAYWSLLRNEGITPDLVMGHSLGEITALAPSGVVTPELAVEMAAYRGMLMDRAAAECGGGGMAVVLFSTSEEVENAIVDLGLDKTLFVANYNAGNQTVISGLTDSLNLFESEFCKERRAKIQRIDVAGPWHTPFINSGREEFLTWVDKKEFSNPETGFILNGTADFAAAGDNLKQRVADQLVRPVFWSDSLQKMVSAADDSTVVLEVGPGKILTGLLRANKVHKKFHSVETVNGISVIGSVVDMWHKRSVAEGSN